MGPACTNGHDLDEYPDEFRGAELVGLNWRRVPEYVNPETDTVYELLYAVDNDRIDELKSHYMPADTVDEHVEWSEQEFGSWCYVRG